MNCFYCFVISGHLSGTPDYLAPEILLRHPHGEGADWWGLGVVLYELLVGVPPFSDETPELVFSNILALNLEFPEGEESLSAEAEGAVRALLRLEQQERAGLQQIQVKCSREGDFHICSVQSTDYSCATMYALKVPLNVWLIPMKKAPLSDSIL